jgi:hypothetical protein
MPLFRRLWNTDDYEGLLRLVHGLLLYYGRHASRIEPVHAEMPCTGLISSVKALRKPFIIFDAISRGVDLGTRKYVSGKRKPSQGGGLDPEGGGALRVHRHRPQKSSLRTMPV